MNDITNILSLGAGVQSSTLALMAAAGEIRPMPNFGIFSDVGNEPTSVYKWLDYLTPLLPFPIYIVKRPGKILSESELEIKLSGKSGKYYRKSMIPAFTRNPDGSIGMLRRKCTQEFKIQPIVRNTRTLASIPRGAKVVHVSQWIGISMDEASRMKPSPHKYIKHRWPLIEQRMTRQDCLDWMKASGYPQPPRSACTFCPYHSDAEWSRLKTEEPSSFASAVQHEKDIQAATLKCEVTKGTPYLHRSCIPIDQVVFVRGGKQLNMFENECEGMCGL